MHINRFMGAHLDNMARSNRFSVEIHGPQGLRSRGMRCTSISAGGKSLTTSQIQYSDAGPANNYVTAVDYGGTVSMTFMLDTTFEDMQFIERWMSLTHDEVWNLSYPEEYHGTVKITQLALDDFPIYSVDLHQAFPSDMSALSFDAGGEGSEVQTFDVEFTYRTWSSAYENSPSGLLGGLFKKFSRKLKTKVQKKIEGKVFG